MEFLLTGLVVADVTVVDGGVTVVFSLRQADKEEDGDGGAASFAEDTIALALADLAGGVAVPAQVVAVDVVELLD